MTFATRLNLPLASIIAQWRDPLTIPSRISKTSHGEEPRRNALRQDGAFHAKDGGIPALNGLHSSLTRTVIPRRTHAFGSAEAVISCRALLLVVPHVLSEVRRCGEVTLSDGRWHRAPDRAVDVHTSARAHQILVGAEVSEGAQAARSLRVFLAGVPPEGHRVCMHAREPSQQCYCNQQNETVGQHAGLFLNAASHISNVRSCAVNTDEVDCGNKKDLHFHFERCPHLKFEKLDELVLLCILCGSRNLLLTLVSDPVTLCLPGRSLSHALQWHRTV